MKEYRHFYKRLSDTAIAVAELSWMPGKPGGTWFYFNRLYVPKVYRRNGAATELLRRVVGWAEREQISIYLDINPYGDMNYEDLEKFYTSFGFVKIDDNFILKPGEPT